MMQMDEPLYRQVLEASVPGLRVEHCTLHVGGWDSVALEVNGTLIFRFPRPNRPEVEAALGQELALLPELAKALPLPIPHFLYVGEGQSGSGRRFVGYRKIDGVELRGSLLSAGQAEQIARQLAEFLTCLHAFPVERAVRLNMPSGSAAEWHRQYEEMYRRICERVLPLLSEAAKAQSAALWEGFLGNEAHFLFRPALIHADLSSDHILYNTTSGALAGIIDWGDAGIGDPALDFVGLLSEYGQPFAEATLAAYRGEKDATFWERMRFYQAIVPFHEALFGMRRGNQTYIQHGVEMIERTLAQPGDDKNE